MACIGCAAKVPRPEFKDEIAALYTWADESEKRFEKLGLPLEAQKMKITKNRARNELKEIQLIERYQKDEKHAPEKSESPANNELSWLQVRYKQRKKDL